jgi:hypothetical protein
MQYFTEQGCVALLGDKNQYSSLCLLKDSLLIAQPRALKFCATLPAVQQWILKATLSLDLTDSGTPAERQTVEFSPQIWPKLVHF